MKTNEELFRAGDKEFLIKLYKNLTPKVRVYIATHYQSLSHDDADDLLQNAIIVALKYSSSRDFTSGGIEGFLWNEIKNKAINLISKQKSVSKYQSAEISHAETYYEIDSDDSLKDRLMLLMDVLRQNAPQCYRLLAAVSVGKDYNYICGEMKLYENTNSAKTAKHNCMTKAKQLLKNLGIL